jgi:hypothetical protein
MLPAVSTVVTVMDRDGWDANTDVVVLVEPARHRLLWIPRDTWCPHLGDRVNAAFKRGGHRQLIPALAELGVRADHSLCLARPAIRQALRDASVRVPVARPLVLRYPLAPEQRIEDGEKLVRFDPPVETLEGERVHQWIGARFEAGRPSSDLDRIARQQVFVRALLEQRFDFARAIANPDWVSTSGPHALGELPAVDASWRSRTLPRLHPVTIDGKSVLVHHPWWRLSLRHL